MALAAQELGAFDVEQQTSQECSSELTPLVMLKITESVCAHFPVSFMGSLLLYLCSVEPRFCFLPRGFQLRLPEVRTQRSER